MRKVAPLSNGFALAGILGFLISAVYIRTLSDTWSFTLMIFFAAVFVASMISAVKAPVDQLDIEELSMHEVANKRRK